MAKELKNIIISYNENNMETCINIQTMRNVFFNVQQMSTQLTSCIVFYIIVPCIYNI
jgi:hypothetical protein